MKKVMLVVIMICAFFISACIMYAVQLNLLEEKVSVILHCVIFFLILYFDNKLSTKYVENIYGSWSENIKRLIKFLKIIILFIAPFVAKGPYGPGIVFLIAYIILIAKVLVEIILEKNDIENRRELW